MTTIGIRFQRNHVDEGAKGWQSPDKVAERLDQLNVKIKLEGHEEAMTAGALRALGRDGLETAGLEWKDTWRLLDDAAIDQNQNQTIDLSSTSELTKAMGIADGVDESYGTPLLNRPDRRPTMPTRERVNLRQDALAAGLRTALARPAPEPTDGQQPAPIAERLADHLFVSRRASTRYLLMEKGPRDLQKLIAAALPRDIEGGRTEVAREIVSRFETQLADAGSEGAGGDRLSWLAQMRENVRSLDSQDAIISFVETKLRGDGSTWQVHGFAEGLSMAGLGDQDRALLLDVVSRQPELLADAHEVPEKLAALSPEDRKSAVDALRPHLTGDGDLAAQKRVLSAAGSIGADVSAPVRQALLGWAATSTDTPYSYSSIAGKLDKMVEALPPMQWRPLLQMISRPELSRDRALGSFADAVGNENLLALPVDTRMALLEIGFEASKSEDAYSPFSDSMAIAKPLAELGAAGVPPAYLDMVREVLMSEPVHGVDGVMEAEKSIRALPAEIRDALVASDTGRQALVNLLGLPRAWRAGSIDANPVRLPNSEDVHGDRLANQFLLDDAAGQAGKLIRGELTAPDHDDRDLVRLGQRMLSLAGHPLGADGGYGPLTRGAIEAYQQKRGLPVNGELNGPTLALLAAEVGNPGVRTSSLALGMGVANANGGPWRSTASWTDNHRAELGRFSEAYRMTHGRAGEPGDGGAMAPEILVAYARQRGLPIGRDQTGGGTTVAIHSQANPLQSARRELQPVSDEVAANTWQFYWDSYKDRDLDCLETFNAGIRSLFRDAGIRPRLGSTVDLSVKALQRRGYAGETRNIEFADKNGRYTRGVSPPKDFLEGHSLAGAAREMAGMVPGFHFFGFSLLDGDHSILVAVDNRDPANPKYFWGDQWSQSRGWKPLTAEGLDARVLENTVDFWTSAANRATKPVKFKTQSRLTPIRVPS